MSTKKMQIIGLKGKSAYQYAQDGGYAGTEAEFKEKMAKELDVVYDYEDLNEAILATAIKPEASGEFIHITDSAPLPIMDFGMEGKTEQETTSGKNLLPIDTLYVDGSSRVKTAEFTLEAGTYMLNSVDRTLLGVIVDNITDGGYLTNGWVETYFTALSVDSSKNITVRFDTDDISSIGGNWMLTKGDTIDTEFEPYTNGPSPNPDYPQEIVNAGVYNEETGRYEHKFTVGNKNFWDKEYARDVNNWFEVASITGTRFLKIPVAKGKTYRIGELPSEAEHIRLTTSTNLSSAYYGWVSNPNIGTEQQLRKFTSKEDFVYLGVSIGRFEIFQEQYNNYLQIELGSTSTEYVVGQSQPFTLTSPVPLTKWDKLVKRDGVYGWSIWSKEYNLNSDITISANNADNNKVRVYIHDVIAKQNSECKCNIFRYFISGTNGTCGFWFVSTFCVMVLNEWLEPYGYVYDSEVGYDVNISNVKVAFKSMIEDKGNIQIWVDMQEEQSFHPLPDSEQALLKELETYYQVTNIYNDQNCPMSIQYIADTQTYIDNLATSLTNAVVSLGGEV